jgi:hypothetical protein
MDFANLSQDGYFCLQSFFVLVNLRAGNIVVLNEDITF